MLTTSRRQQVIHLCQALIQAQSYSGHEDGVVARMQQAFHELAYDDVFVDSYGNVLGRIQGNRPGKVLLLDGHIDTVPVPDPSCWTHQPFGVNQGECEFRGMPADGGTILIDGRKGNAQEIRVE